MWLFFGIDAFMWNSFTKFTKSSLITSQQHLRNLKLKPSSPELLFPWLNHTTSLFSTNRNGFSNFYFYASNNIVKSTHSRVSMLRFSSWNLFLKKIFASYMTSSTLSSSPLSFLIDAMLFLSNLDFNEAWNNLEHESPSKIQFCLDFCRSRLSFDCNNF